jgi:hypothetical protein
VNVTFTAPGSGASGTFSNNTATITVVTDASGIASATFTANGTAGAYTVTAAASGVPNVGFSLTNLAGTPTSMAANPGTTPQTASVNKPFANALAVTVKDGGTNPVPGVNVTFTAPGSGASGTFSNNTATITVVTNASGVASATFTANGNAGGPYNVTAAAAGLTTVNFSLTNRPVLPPTFSMAFGTSRLYYYTGSDNTTLSFALTNPSANGISLTNLSFTDTLPAGLLVNTPNGLTGTCGGGTITALAGSSSISLTGATLAAGDACTFSVQVRGVGLGTQVNTTSNVTADGGIVGPTATALLVVSALIYYWFFA